MSAAPTTVQRKRRFKPQPLPAAEPMERQYRFEEIAELAGVTPRAVRRWVDEGRIGYIQLPHGRRITARHWAAFIKANEVPPEE